MPSDIGTVCARCRLIDGRATAEYFRRTLAALAALEAEERDAEESALLQEADTDCERIAQREDATPPAPHSVYCECLICDPPSAPNEATPPVPLAADTITDAFARDFFVRHDHTYSGIEIYEWLKKQVTGPAAPPAAECAAQRSGFWLIHFEDNEMPVEIFTDKEAACKRYHACLLNWTCHLFEMIAPAALAAPCECQRLREENAELTRLVNSYREEAANFYSAREHCVTHDEALADCVEKDKRIAALAAELADAKSEVARLTAERDHIRNQRDSGHALIRKIQEAVESADIGDRANEWDVLDQSVSRIAWGKDDLAAELRQAVDALREAQWGNVDCRHRCGNTTVCHDCSEETQRICPVCDHSQTDGHATDCHIGIAIAAYDAKHREGREQ